jgi:hypothetical protein
VRGRRGQRASTWLMTLLLPDWLIDADEWPWRTRLTLAAVLGPDKQEGRIPLRVLARQTLLSIPLTITPALDWLEAEGWIERQRGYPTRTTNLAGKRHATGRLLAVDPDLTSGTFTVIGAMAYDRLATAENRWRALRSASLLRRNRALVRCSTDTEVDLVRLCLPHIRNPSPKEVLRPTDGVVAVPFALDALMETRFFKSRSKIKSSGDGELGGLRASDMPGPLPPIKKAP